MTAAERMRRADRMGLASAYGNPVSQEAIDRAKAKRYTIGTGAMTAKNHAICDGACIVAVVNGKGYSAPATKKHPACYGWDPRSEAMTQWIVDAMNEKAERE